MRRRGGGNRVRKVGCFSLCFRAAPLPFRGGAGGGGLPWAPLCNVAALDPADSPHPNPSPEGEGLCPWPAAAAISANVSTRPGEARPALRQTPLRVGCRKRPLRNDWVAVAAPGPAMMQSLGEGQFDLHPQPVAAMVFGNRERHRHDLFDRVRRPFVVCPMCVVHFGKVPAGPACDNHKGFSALPTGDPCDVNCRSRRLAIGVC